MGSHSMSNYPLTRWLSTIAIIIIGICLTAPAYLLTPIGPAIGLPSEHRNNGGPASDISPQIAYATYFGGDDFDEFVDVAIGLDGSIYVVGNPNSIDLPTSSNAFQKISSGNRTGYVAKFSADGTTLIYATYLGGSIFEVVAAIDVDTAGCAYIVGTTGSNDFPTTIGTIRTTFEGSDEAFVVKLSPDGSALEYSTFLGGEITEGAEDIIVDRETGECIVVGYSQSRDFPTTVGAYDREPYGWDGFICGINHNGTALSFSSFLGGEGQDRIQEVTLDGSGNIVVCGFTNSDQFPTTGTAFQRTRTGLEDGFITVMDSRATRVIRSTFLGGSANDWCEAIVVTEEGNIAVSGRTEGHNLPVSTNAICSTFGGGKYDAYLTILNGDLDSLVYSTYLGGLNNERTGDLTIDALGNLYLIGRTESPEFPVTANAIKGNATEDHEEFFFVVMDPSGPILRQSTFIGGDGTERGFGISLGLNGAIVLVGATSSRDFPVTDDAYQGSKASIYEDAGLIIIHDFLPPRANAGPDVVIDQHDTVTFNGTISRDNGRIVNWTWSFTDENLKAVIMNGLSPSHTFDAAGLFEVLLNVTDAKGNWALDRVNVTVRDITPPIAVLAENVTVGQNEPLLLNGSMSTDNVGIISWRWTIGDTDNTYQFDEEVFEYTYREVGIFNITLNVTDAAGSWAEATMMVTVTDTTPPIAMAGDDVEIDQGDTITLDARASTDNVGIVNWTWSLQIGDDTVQRFLPYFEHIFADAGEFQLDLVVGDAAGNVGEDSLMVRVRDTTDPVADAGEDMYAEQGLEVNFDGSLSTDNVGVFEWSWSFEDGGTIVVLKGPNPDYVYKDAGEYVVELTVTDAAGNSATDMVTVTLRDTTPPTADAGNNITVDQHEIASFDGKTSSDNVAVVNWTWRFTCDGKDHVLHGSSFTFVFEKVGTFEVTMEVRDEADNAASDSVTVLVNDITPPTAEAGLNVTVKRGDIVTFDGTTSSDNVGIINWTWTFVYRTEVVDLHGDRSEFEFDKPGKYTVTMTVKDGDGNEATDTLMVTVRKVETGEDTPWLLIAVIIIAALLLGAVAWMMKGRMSTP